MADLIIVDDDTDMGDLLSDFLRSEGHDVRVARNGAEGLELIRDRAPDLTIVDVEMPIMTGPDMALQLLVHDCGLEEIPVVLCSGVLHLGDVAARVGTPYFVAKPYELAELDAVIRRALVERRAPTPMERSSS
jgi:DNA-binding NtrC family response regulator